MRDEWRARAMSTRIWLVTGKFHLASIRQDDVVVDLRHSKWIEGQAGLDCCASPGSGSIPAVAEPILTRS